jgi:hypothetical protein
MKNKIENEIKRFNRFQNILGQENQKTDIKDIDIRNYAKYLLQEGSIGEKRELLACLKSELVYMDKKIKLV